MSRRLLRLGVRVHPEKGMFRVHALGADPTGLQAPSLAVGALTGVGYDQMWIGTLQDDVDVTILLEEWDGEPPAGKGRWEHDVVEELYLRGAVAVSTATAEPVLHGIRLMGGVGRYHARVRAQHRTQIAQLYDALLGRYPNASFSEEFQVALSELQGVEHYLLQLWPMATPAAPPAVVAAGDTLPVVSVFESVAAAVGPLGPLTPPDHTEPLPALPDPVAPRPPLEEPSEAPAEGRPGPGPAMPEIPAAGSTAR